MKGTFRKDLQIASIRSQSLWNKFKVHTLLQNPGQKQPSINAYLGARYSRSSDSILDIAKEIIENNTDAAQRLENIFHGYGHKSVGDMADLFVCIENIPMFAAMKIFYLNSVIAGQERSTRYQNFESPEFVKIPKEVCSDIGIRKAYDKIMLKEMNDYRKLLKKTKTSLNEYFKINDDNKEEKSALQARSFDTARYLLPYGLNTSMAAVMSARNWSELISYLNASDSVVENEVGKLLLNLLGESKVDIPKYIREADGLIRHTDANCCRRNSTRNILKYLRSNISNQKKYINKGCEGDSCKVSYNTHPIEDLLTHYELLLNPLGSKKELEFDFEDEKALGELIFENHNHHNLMGNIGQSGAIKLEGMATLGTLKDLNRHRSMERYMPLFHDEVDMDNELNRSSKDCFFLCNYLEIKELEKLRKEYEKALVETYDMIKKWKKDAQESMPEEVVKEYVKYLLPHAHSTKYSFYGSFDDLQYTINLRTRRGGHIAYRVLVYKWLELLNKSDSIWYSLHRSIEKPNPKSKEQFVDRS
ncbi:MAG: FAD-dependent thymidylate synthase [Candidatus Dojkabacteria bacterium]|jgi:thymidylate synthase ThyX|nr:FAD-dependent thymidylate synthase [Candidatus Dojkabacteria bacterium]